MKKFLVLSLLSVFVLPLFAQNQAFKSFDTQTAVGWTAPLQVAIKPSTSGSPGSSALGFVPSSYTIRLTVTGTPATCTYSVLGSTKYDSDNPAVTDFTNGELTPDIDCTASSPVIVHVINKPWNSVIGHLKTFTGGSSPTIKLELLAK